MFSIEWLNGASLVEREDSFFTNVQRVVDFARTRASTVRRRHPGAGFLAVYMIDGGPGRSRLPSQDGKDVLS
jgi:hypothetical protein